MSNETSYPNGIDPELLPRPVLPEHESLVELYNLAWRLAAGNIRESRGRRHMDAAWDPKRNYQWVWDTCFMALYCRYAADQFPGVESLDNFYELQRDDGYISMTYDMTSAEEPWPDRINPPLFAWVEHEHYRATGDASRLERILPHLEKLMGWIDRNRRTQPHRRLRAIDSPDAGRGESFDTYQLYYFRDCGSSGMDDAPRAPRHADAGQYLDWIDLSAQMALSFHCLAVLYDVIGKTERADHWRARHDDLGKLINDELWCERTRFYHDRTLPRNFVPCKTVAGFWPILAGICPTERLNALVRHLRDRATFRRPIPVPSLAADDPNYNEKGTYWTGGVWAPTNYMITRGLQLAGRGDDAHAIAIEYLDGLAATWELVEPHTLWECNCPEAARPGMQPYTGTLVKPDFVGWSGLGPIAMLIENVLGFDVDTPARTVSWHIRLPEEHGIERLPVASGGRLRAHCQARAKAKTAAHATLQMDGGEPLTVHLHRRQHHKTLTLQPGGAVEVTL